MSEHYISPNARPYIPASLSEIWDLLGSMVLGAPTFKSRFLPDKDVNTELSTLVAGFDSVRLKLGEGRYAKLVDLAERAKALFAADQDDTNGKTDQGRELLFEMEDVIREVRSNRTQAELRDGEVSRD